MTRNMFGSTLSLKSTAVGVPFLLALLLFSVADAGDPKIARAVAPSVRCESAKNKEVGKRTKCVAGVFSKAVAKFEAPDGVKLTKCGTKFSDKFTKIEDKAAGACPTVGDAAAVGGDVDACLDAVITNLGGPMGAGDDTDKCQGKKVKQAGKFLDCRMKATAKGIKKGLAPDYTKCDEKVLSAFTKLDDKGGCAATGDAPAVQSDLTACADAASASLTGVVGPACGDGTVDAGEQCDDGNLVNGDGCSDQCTVEGTVEYSQDFEALDQGSLTALGDDGWLIFANVFAPDGVTYLYGYGVFPAPNDPGAPAFCLIADSQGGTEQGSQQLVVFSDYNNADHGVGNRIESNVFQERSIVASDVGKTITFLFDAKRGDINDPSGSSTALAFFKTLDPGAGFATTNFITTDTTSLPITWSTLSISIDITAGLVGQLLQFGYNTTATNFDPSGNFYDNIVVSSVGGTTVDADGDGYCIPNGLDGNTDGDCDDAGENTADVDCNDADATSFPQATELICADGADNDCDGNADASDSDCTPIGGELTINGDFETGDITGWTDFSAANNGTFAATMAQANGGAWSGNLVASVPGGGGPASFPVVKQANIGLGTVTPNSSITISFDLFGSLAGVGGVVFAEFFSELTGGGTSKAEILSGAPLLPNPPNDWTAGWVSYSFTTTTGPDVSGGVTLQLKTDCGANPGCTVDVFFDNVSVTVP
jgi:cysteine-rich repeat protein